MITELYPTSTPLEQWLDESDTRWSADIPGTVHGSEAITYAYLKEQDPVLALNLLDEFMSEDIVMDDASRLSADRVLMSDNSAGDDMSVEASSQMLKLLEPLVVGDSLMGEFDAMANEAWTRISEVVKSGDWQKRLLEGLNAGIESGHLPAEILDRAHLFFSERISIGVLNTVEAGHYSPLTDEIVLSWNLETPEEILSTLIHEFAHRIAGKAFVAEATEGASVSRSGFRTVIDAETGALDGKKTFLDEALTEGLTLAILEGDFSHLHLDVEDGGYLEYRLLISDVIDKAGGLIQLSSMYNSYFEDTQISSGINVSARKTVLSEFISAYGYGAIRKLDILSRTIPHLTAEEGQDMGALLSRITPPTFDSEGRVAEIGVIDIDGLDDQFNSWWQAV